MRILSLLLILLTIRVLTFAQFKIEAEGQPFDEPQSGYARIVQMKNGNTVCLYISLQESIDVSIYTADHARKLQKHIEPELGRSKGFKVNSIFEVAGDVVVFISEVNDKHPVLYRILIDGETGELKREDKLSETDRMRAKGAIIADFKPDSSFYIRKDPDGDNYGIVVLHRNDNRADRQAIEVILYNGKHKEINKNYYVPPFARYHFFDYLDMAVIGDKLSMVGYAYDQIAEDYKDGNLVISSLDKEGDHIVSNDVPIRDGQIVDSAIVKYNPVTKKLLLLGTSHAQSSSAKEQYNGFLAVLDPNTQKVDKEINIYPENVNKRKKELFGNKEGFLGMPQQLFVEEDGGFTVVYEELTRNSTTHISGDVYTYCYLDNAAIATFDMNGKEISSALIPKAQVMRNLEVSSFYITERETFPQRLSKGEQYKSLLFLNGKQHKYVLLNDVEENTTSAAKGQLTSFRTQADCNGYYYTLSADNILPSRDFLFGKPLAKENNIVLFTVSDYDRTNNIFVTLKIEKKGRGRDAKLVWFKP